MVAKLFLDTKCMKSIIMMHLYVGELLQVDTWGKLTRCTRKAAWLLISMITIYNLIRQFLIKVMIAALLFSNCISIILNLHIPLRLRVTHLLDLLGSTTHTTTRPTTLLLHSQSSESHPIANNQCYASGTHFILILHEYKTYKQGKMKFFFNLFILICAYACSVVDIMPELKRNILNFGYGVNFKYERMLAHILLTDFM